MLRILCYKRKKRFRKCHLLCLHSTVHSRDVPSEPVEAPGPGCDSGRDGGTGSTTMSKSDTFQGPGGFRTPSAPGRVAPPPTPTPHSETRDVTRQTGQRRHMREFTQHRKRVRLEREEKEIIENQVQAERETE